MTPLAEYTRRKADREIVVGQRERTHFHLGNAKVAVFLVAVAYTAVKLANHPSAIVYGTLAALFVALSIWHEVVMRALARARAAVEHYADGIARIEDRWMRDTPSGDRFKNRDHPYAEDLDLFGPRSLFQLISTCRTLIGEDRLAGWLLRGSSAADIRGRQQRVAALRQHIDLRERIAVVNAGRRQTIHPESLVAWAGRPRELPAIRIAVVALAAAFVAAFANYLNGGAGLPVVLALLVNGAILGWLHKRADAIAESLSGATAAAALDLFANVVREIEREAFKDEASAQVAARLAGASGAIASLARIADWSDSRHNVFLKLSEIPILFTLQLAYAAESWRRRHGHGLADWIDAAGEMEALLSLAGYSYEHPGDPFAEIVEGHAVCFDAVDVAHPLLERATVVANSLKICVASPPQILIVSGSNMSGKSTLMRTVGINAVLALAGAPVRAKALRITPLDIGTCLRHTDSLQEHRSGFYTEALRIRLVADLLDRPLPLLFLFDELLSGTNSKDRRTAAEGVIKTMLARGAIGMITTHDLALTEIAGMFPGEVRNVHLQDRVENGRMVFDYKLKDGVITHSNALELMRIIGLDV